ncbi:hypothetical protein COV61_02510 [Candidatus Micrarchaeota archaeon CG11_big_fil_rev_8_21_14_0_20_47_5]|nr:MAG: hypothetical protein AUJ17_00435 [Candidatus Micrarchaeota archaeon CG1_02_47_40]PIN83651.1 MAG: hypothetical protein COV61_02510 [Candidatus Micrarchaeota archaeon CG11_big_fil_rev_8_21_14_0_20_47_5]
MAKAKKAAQKSACGTMSEMKFDLVVGIILIAIGALMLLENTGMLPKALAVWPVILVIAGFGMVFKGAFE